MSLSQESYQRINFTQSRIGLKTIAKGLTRITVFKYRTMSKTNVLELQQRIQILYGPTICIDRTKNLEKKE